jgi:putative N6-adenine-specific DNA methylase
MAYIDLIATATFGLESVVAKELKHLGYETKVENARVTYKADEMSICRSNLWLRTADRVLIKLGEFKATTFEELFEGTKNLPWERWITKDAQFPVDGKSVDSTLHHVPSCQSIVKKAIVERLKEKYKIHWFPEEGPRYRVEVAILKDMATLTIDTSGPGLHKRGYREEANEAPLKETLAAALIQIARWHPNHLLIDPMCGSGTIPIEAALIGKNIPPGIRRDFVSEGWSNIPKKVWENAREEGNSLIKKDRVVHIIGSDIDGFALRIARENSIKAGVEDLIHFQKLGLNELSTKKKYGYVICNPPYGERLGEKEDVEELYKEMGKKFRSLDTWSYFIISAHEDFEKFFGKKADKKRKLYNGRIKCDYYQYFGPKPPRPVNKEEDNTLLQV